jgi:radical SAM protein with 4Fe4S-binding SPASM domain
MTIRNGFDFLIQWHLTERCNLACRHCYQSGKHSAELSLDEIATVIDEIEDLFHTWESAYGIAVIPSFNITGGEPLLREDLFEVLELLQHKNYPTFLLTNGMLIDVPTAEQLARAGIRGAQVSIEGPQEIHDSIRGSGSFAGAVQGVTALRAAGIPVTLNTTLSRLNASCLEDLVHLAIRLGVQRLGFSRLVPSGRGKEISDESLSSAEIKELYEILLAMNLPDLEIVTGDPIANHVGIAPPALPGSATPFGGCAAGVSGLTIMPDGTVTPCRRLPISIGNVRTDSLRELWATSPILERLRDKSSYTGKCGACPRWSDCRGCRGVAYAFSCFSGTPDYLAEDPHCFL